MNIQNCVKESFIYLILRVKCLMSLVLRMLDLKTFISVFSGSSFLGCKTTYNSFSIANFFISLRSIIDNELLKFSLISSSAGELAVIFK